MLLIKMFNCDFVKKRTKMYCYFVVLIMESYCPTWPSYYKNLVIKKCKQVSNAAEIVDLGLKDNLIKAMEYLPTRRQSVLCTSDHLKGQDLTKIVLKKDPLYYDNIGNKEDDDTVDCTLNYLYCTSEKRLF